MAVVVEDSSQAAIDIGDTIVAGGMVVAKGAAAYLDLAAGTVDSGNNFSYLYH